MYVCIIYTSVCQSVSIYVCIIYLYLSISQCVCQSFSHILSIHNGEDPAHMFRSQGDRASSWFDTFRGMGSWKDNFSVILGKTWLICSDQGRQSFESFSWKSELQVNMIVLVARWRLFLHCLICWGLRQTVLWAIFLGDRPLSQYSSFSGKMVLKRPLLSDTVEDWAHWFRSWGHRAFNHSFWRYSFELIQ